jgi:hypothetical protein
MRSTYARWFEMVLFSVGLSSCAGGGCDPGAYFSGKLDLPHDHGVSWTCAGSATDADNGTPYASFPSAGVDLEVCANPEVPLSDVIEGCLTLCKATWRQYGIMIAIWNGNNFIIWKDPNCTIIGAAAGGGPCQPGSVVQLNGGPAQNRAELQAATRVFVDLPDPLGTVTRHPGGHGQLGYTVLPLEGPCPPGGCLFLVNDLEMSIDDFTIDNPIKDAHVTGIHMINHGPIEGRWFEDGTIRIPAGAATLGMTFALNGDGGSTTGSNPSELVGTLNRATGELHLDNLSAPADGADISGSVAGTTVTWPPTAVIEPLGPFECNVANGARVTFDGAASRPWTGAPISRWAWGINDTPAGVVSTLATTLPLGATEIELAVADQAGAFDVAAQDVTVVDTTRPVFPALAPVTATLCDPNSEDAVLDVPVAGDICDPHPVVVGQVIATNGVPLAPPVPVVNGRVRLPVGSHVVRWTATDASGNSTSVQQTLALRPAIYVTRAAYVRDRAALRASAANRFATLANTGALETNIGVDAQTGDIYSVASVVLRERARVNGSLFTTGTVTKQNGTVVTGREQRGVAIQIPPPMDLAGVVFPPTSRGDAFLEPGQLRTLDPGRYGTIAVKSRAVLTLRSGTYHAEQLQVEPQATITLDEASGPVTLYVRGGIIYRGRIVDPLNRPQRFLLGYLGTNGVFIEAPLRNTTLVAPSARVVIGSLGTTAYVGEIFAREIEVQPDASVVCDLGPSDGHVVTTSDVIAVRPAPVVAPEAGCSVGAGHPWEAAGGLTTLLLGALALRARARVRRR